ncbi:DUF1878 domain-containing protein [Clostridium botulinum]|nr:DUF1878 domain-containing protein [Clostridium botulinum]NFN20796.1 DUF1878 domain-containing protein [Clostridium botulinum]NFN42014.1 DUF1878 domain-containing protein [Clostridium botulinum]
MEYSVEELFNYCKELEKRVKQLEFRQTLMLSDTNTNRLLLDYNITQSQYKSIMDIMDTFRKEIGSGKKVSHNEFENSILKIVNRYDIDYHFCEYIAKAFMDDERWEEVFPALYGDMAKYAYLKEDK